MHRSRLTRRSLFKLGVAGSALAGVVSLTVTPALPAAADISTQSFSLGKYDHVLYWNRVILDVFRHTGGTPGPLTRGGAMMNLAVYDAVNSVFPIGKPYLTKDPAAFGAVGALNTAIDYAAYTALKSAFPSYPTPDLDTKLNTALAMPDFGSTSDKNKGRLLGIKTANAIIADRTGDGSEDTTPYVPTIEPGHWRPDPARPAGGANWGKVKPFALTSGSQFRPGPIGGFTNAEQMLKSPEYAAQVNELKAIGGRTSTARTADQTQAAHFWANDIEGTYKPVGQQYDHTIAVYTKYRPFGTSFNSAKLFALTSIALADAGIAVWDSKYSTDWDVWRPEHAINLADQVPNPAITPDPSWKPLEQDLAGNSFSPSFPTYTSGHSGIAAAWAGILRNYFGTDSLSFTGATDDPFAQGVTRSFSSLSSAAKEKADSRKWLGVHFEWDNAAALELGYKVSDYVYANVLN
ncbi:hypothetical protein ACFHYQ_24520 [Sphaerimonospora cavernae]|uniref:PAP2 superfamily protein n=1 Tax=Sphaerimonospora cavernae TaxID=1740611 RepID=A0ABV6UBC1_9ACTN